MGNYCCKKSSIKNVIEEPREMITTPHPSISKEIEFQSYHLSNHYTVNYPIHEKRVETAIFRKTRREMAEIPCFICGNHKGEVHHFYIEKAATNAIDWEKFAIFADNCYNIQSGEKIGDKFDWKEVEKNPDIFVDSKYNMIILCKEHHTSGKFGIHHVPYPDWILQKFAKDGFQFLTIE